MRFPNIAAWFSLKDKPSETKTTKPVFSIAPKSISRVRKDIADWNRALQMAMLDENPKTWSLYNLLDEIMQDALLKSQTENRRNKSLSQTFSIIGKDGKVNQEITDLLQNKIFVNEVNTEILNTKYLKHSLGQWIYADGRLKFQLIPRQNVDPVTGLVYQDYTEDKFIKYREMSEYGVWVLEFGDTTLSADFGLINAVVPHVLFKRFAQSCWSELCEIYGIPPRVMKTNTQDKRMLNRAEQMMRDMGAAAYFIIDESEKFEWAQSVQTNGDVYKNMIHLCNNEISMPISGAIIGQDTVNGNRSKEQANQNLLEDLVQADLSLIEQEWNSKILNSLQLIGEIPQGEYYYKYDKAEDLDKLFGYTKDLLNAGKEVDDKWITDKFGVPITGERQNQQNAQKLSADFFF
jgi:hypothetical protein